MHSNTPSTERTSSRRSRIPTGQLLLWLTIGAFTAATLARLSTGEALRLLGLPDPGAVTSLGLPAVMAAGEVCAVVAVGSLMLAAALIPAQASGLLDVDGYLAVRVAGVAALLWAACALVLVPLTVSDTSGRSVQEMLADPMPFLRAVGDIDAAVAWAWTGALASLLGLGCLLTLRHWWTPALLGLAVLALLPRAMSGHSASGGSHDVATNSLVLHTVAAAIWVGGLAALVMHVQRGGAHLDLAVYRFSRIATIAFIAVAASGVVNAVVRVPVSDLFTSTYGVLVVAKVAAFVVGGVLGYRQRRIAVHAITLNPADRKAFALFATAEIVLLVATVGVAVALGRTPPPPPRAVRVPSPLEETLGYALDKPPTPVRLMLDWRFDLLLGTAAIVLALVYLAGVRRLGQAGIRWPHGLCVAWLGGCALLLLATSSGIGRFAPAVFSVHVTAMTLLGLAAPLCLAAGAPLTLLQATLGRRTQAPVPGLREWLRALRISAPGRALTRPAVAWVLFVGGFAVFHFGGVFDAVAGSHAWHVVANIYALGTGYLLFWVGLGLDPTGNSRLSHRASLAFLGSAVSAYIGLAALLSSSAVIAEDYYVSLRREWLPDLEGDQHLGASIAMIIGLLVLGAIAVTHPRADWLEE